MSETNVSEAVSHLLIAPIDAALDRAIASRSFADTLHTINRWAALGDNRLPFCAFNPPTAIAAPDQTAPEDGGLIEAQRTDGAAMYPAAYRMSLVDDEYANIAYLTATGI